MKDDALTRRVRSVFGATDSNGRMGFERGLLLPNNIDFSGSQSCQCEYPGISIQCIHFIAFEGKEGLCEVKRVSFNMALVQQHFKR
jgi:hypothetical protein